MEYRHFETLIYLRLDPNKEIRGDRQGCREREHPPCTQVIGLGAINDFLLLAYTTP